MFEIGPMSPIVKKIVIINVVIWLVFQMIIEQFFLSGSPFTYYLSLIPDAVVNRFFIWQPVTYMFLHSMNWFHILFNMLILWWFGSELELRWGSRFFLLYYFVCGVGAAFFYIFGVVLFAILGGSKLALITPVIGASGAMFGIILACGIIFSERTVYFFMLFPMKMKYFAMLLAGIEVVTLLSRGPEGSGVANLAHLGGLVSGYLFLVGYTKWRGRRGLRRRRLRLVVDNEEAGVRKYWN